MDLIHRDLLEMLAGRVKHQRIVAVLGARQTGKTTLCEQLLPGQLKISHTYISFDDPEERGRFQRAGSTVLESLETPLVILDEVQKIPPLLETLKLVSDRQKRQKSSQQPVYILTGSSRLLLLKSLSDTLAGRVSLLSLYPFSLGELISETGIPLLTHIYKRENTLKRTLNWFETQSPEMVRRVIRISQEHRSWGGYPPVWERKDRAEKIRWLKDYRSTYVERDIQDVGRVASTDAFVLVQKLLCARTGQILSLSEVARDAGLSVNTVKRYLFLLEAGFQCFLLRPFFSNISKRFIKSPKVYFPDPGINRVILGETTISTGAAYESWVFSELLKWRSLQFIEPELFFYRSTGGLEIDFLICGEARILPIKAKASEKVSAADGRSLALFMDQHRKASPLGLVVYPGRTLLEIRKNIWAIPDWLLFGIKI
jgi:uncharacterized protein